MIPLQGYLFRDRDVMSVDGTEPQDEQGEQDHDDPGAVHEFRTRDDQGGEPGGHGAHAVDDELFPPVPTSLGHPAPDHAGLREREGQEDADGIQRDERMRVPMEQDNQGA